MEVIKLTKEQAERWNAFIDDLRAAEKKHQVWLGEGCTCCFSGHFVTEGDQEIHVRANIIHPTTKEDYFHSMTSHNKLNPDTLEEIEDGNPR